MNRNSSTSELDDRVAIITGGGSGIGAATARLLAAKGLGVAIVGRTAAKLDHVVAGIESDGGRAWAVQADLADVDAPKAIVDEVVDRAGRLDVVINNAAAIKVGPVQSYSVEDFDLHTATNLRAPFFLVSCALPHLRRSPAAAVVNISSVIGSPLVKPGNTVYGLTKAAIEYFSRAAAHDPPPGQDSLL